VGVVFKLLQAVYRLLKQPENRLLWDLDLVALGTIADQVPLVDENRVLAALGLKVLGRTKKAGLKALKQVVGLKGPVDAWQEYADFSFPGGEAVADFVQRVGEMLAVFSSSGLERIAVVTHGGVIRTMICLALGLPARHYLLFDVRPASLSVLELFDRGGVLKGLNL